MKHPPDLNTPAEIPEHVRPINFAGIELLLDLLHSARAFYDNVDLESLLILLCVSDATMRSFMLDPTSAEAVMQVARPPEEIRGSISRRVIADKTGLPRETVRRKTSELAHAGHVTVDADDRVRISYGLTDARGWRAIEQGHQAVLRYLDRLREFGLDPHAVVDQFSS